MINGRLDTVRRIRELLDGIGVQANDRRAIFMRVTGKPDLPSMDGGELAAVLADIQDQIHEADATS